MIDYANTREFCRSVPKSYVQQAFRDRILGYLGAAALGAMLGVMLGLGV